MQICYQCFYSALMANSKLDYSNEIADLHTAERFLIPEEQVNTLNEETHASVDGAAVVFAWVNT